MRSFKIGVVRFLTVICAMLMLGTSTFAQVSVTIPPVSGVIGSTGTGAITVGDLTGKNVTAFQFTLSYDKSVIDITGATAGTLLAGKDAPTVNADLANGKLYVAWASATALSGSGTLLNLNISYKAFGATALDFGSTFLFNAGTPAATVTNGSVLVPAVVLTAGGANYNAGGAIKIPIAVTALTDAQNVKSYDFVATYDASVITLTNFDQAGTITEGKGQAVINVTTSGNVGTVRLAWANADKIVTTGGILVYLTGTAKAAGTTGITFSSVNFNAGTPTGGGATPGLIVVAKAPSLVINPVATPVNQYAVSEGQTLTLTLVTDDPTATLSTAVPPPSGATLTGNVFKWVVPYSAVTSSTGAFPITFKATNTVGTTSVSVSITVTNVPMAPVFVTGLPANAIAKVHIAPNPVYTYWTFVATSPENKPLAFSLVAGPSGSSITLAGVFSWAPTVEQAGKSYVVTVQVTDGVLSATKTGIVTASSDITGIVDVIPTEFRLSQNYPNPFNPTTAIEFSLPKDSHVKLSVLNILGQEVASLVNNRMGAGVHKVNFDASKLHSGMYIYKIEADNFVSMKKMMLVK